MEEAKALGIKSVWLQPGTYDDEILGFALKEFEGGVGGEEGGTVGGEGWCVLVDGERAAKAAGRDLKLWGEGKLARTSNEGDMLWTLVLDFTYVPQFEI